jgi:hypothetical protein
MPTQCSRDLFGFARVEGREVEAAFDGGDAISDLLVPGSGDPSRDPGFAQGRHGRSRIGSHRASLCTYKVSCVQNLLRIGSWWPCGQRPGLSTGGLLGSSRHAQGLLLVLAPVVHVE